MNISPKKQSSTLKYKIPEHYSYTFSKYAYEQLSTIGGIDNIVYRAYYETLLNHGIHSTDFQSESNKYKGSKGDNNDLYNLLINFKHFYDITKETKFKNNLKKSMITRALSNHSSSGTGRSFKSSSLNHMIRKLGNNEFRTYINDEVRKTDKNGKPIYSKFMKHFLKKLMQLFIQEDGFQTEKYNPRFFNKTQRLYTIIKEYLILIEKPLIDSNLKKLTKLYF